MSADSVSSNIFGINVPAGTGAPGSSNGNLYAGDTSTGAPNDHGSAPHNNADTVTPTMHTLSENVSDIADQSGMPHDGVEAAQVHGALAAFGAVTTVITGASGSATVSHDHNGVN